VALDHAKIYDRGLAAESPVHELQRHFDRAYGKFRRFSYLFHGPALFFQLENRFPLAGAGGVSASATTS
jgi:hypothetical protein